MFFEGGVIVFFESRDGFGIFHDREKIEIENFRPNPQKSPRPPKRSRADAPGTARNYFMIFERMRARVSSISARRYETDRPTEARRAKTESHEDKRSARSARKCKILKYINRSFLVFNDRIRHHDREQARRKRREQRRP